LITGSADGLELGIRTTANKSTAIDWVKISPVRVSVPAAEFSKPSAIYVESRSYQTRNVNDLNVCIVGHYPEADAKILSVHMPR
jgi:hypothetical protein